MRGSLVYLDRVRDEDDLEQIATWAAGPSSVYSSGRAVTLRPEELQEMLRTSGTNILIVRAVADHTPVGMMTWRQLTYPGSYTMGIAVGDEGKWGAGLGMEAVILLITHLFHDLNAHRLHVEVAAFNVGMLPVFANGMVRVEGVLRDYFFVDGAYHDCVVGSMLRSEYYRVAAEFGGPLDSVAPEIKAQGKAAVEELLLRENLPGLVRDPATSRATEAQGAAHA